MPLSRDKNIDLCKEVMNFTIFIYEYRLVQLTSRSRTVSLCTKGFFSEKNLTASFVSLLPLLAITTIQETLSVEPHPGTEVIYHWMMGNGDEIITKEMSINYTWPDDGVYNITVVAYNDISRFIAEVR